MYKLYQHYGWSKYIVVVLSITIREGIYKAFQITEEHFMSRYGSKIRYFIYNSKQLHKGNRIDAETPGVDVHKINVLTVIASESYETFAKGLQSEIAEALSERPQKADKEFFLNNVVKNARGEELVIDETQANRLYRSFIKNDYIDDNDYLTEKYYKELEEGKLSLPEEFKDFTEGIVQGPNL